VRWQSGEMERRFCCIYIPTWVTYLDTALSGARACIAFWALWNRWEGDEEGYSLRFCLRVCGNSPRFSAIHLYIFLISVNGRVGVTVMLSDS